MLCHVCATLLIEMCVVDDVEDQSLETMRRKAKNEEDDTSPQTPHTSKSAVSSDDIDHLQQVMYETSQLSFIGCHFDVKL